MKLEQIVGWSKNPRDIDEDGLRRLKDKLLTLGQFRPLIMTKDEGYTVALGGNMRIRAMKELVEKGHTHFNDVWVTHIDFKEENGKWFAYIGDKKLGLLDAKKKEYQAFDTKEAGMFLYSMADNSRDGHYVEEQVYQQAKEYAIVDSFLNMMHVDTAYTTGLDALIYRRDMADTRARGSGKADADRSTVKDKKVQYDNATIKQIVLYYPTAEYEAMLDFFEQMEEEIEEVDSNTAAVNYLKKFYEDNRPKGS